MILFSCIIILSCSASNGPDTLIPSSHRKGFVRQFALTPPASPTTPPKSPKKEWQRDDLRDWVKRRRANSMSTSKTIEPKKGWYKKSDESLDDSKASTYVSDEDEDRLNNDEEITEITVVNVPIEEMRPDQNWWDKFCSLMRIRYRR